MLFRSMGILTTGFDQPDIDAIVMLRPTMSTALYVQLLGRGMRTHPSKEDCLVLDFTDNILRHGPVDQIEIAAWDSPSAGDGEVKRAPQKECEKCGSIVPAQARECGDCGFEFPMEHTPKHNVFVSGAPIMSTGPKNIYACELFNVQDVEYTLHNKKGRPPSMKVTYRCGLRTFSEWVCFEHQGYAASKARMWWRSRDRDIEELPTTDRKSTRLNSSHSSVSRMPSSA